MLRKRIFRIKRRARLKTIRSMSLLFILYKDVSPNHLWHHQLKTKRITNYHKFEMIFLFSTLKIQRKKKHKQLHKKIMHTKLINKKLIHCIKNTYLLIYYVEGIRSLRCIYFWFIFSIWRDFKILRSIILLHLPIILN